MVMDIISAGISVYYKRERKKIRRFLIKGCRTNLFCKKQRRLIHMSKILKDFSPEEQQQICQQYIEGASGLKLAQQYDSKPHVIYGILRRHNISMRDDREKSLKFRCNEHYFDIINTEHKAYWLGLLAADGYIKDATPLGFGISLKDEDKYILEELKKDIEFTGEIKTYTTKPGYSYTTTTYSRLVISSPYLRERLIQLGIKSHKTTVLTFPTNQQIPQPLIRHFIRGYIDGNGSITHGGPTLLDRPQIKVCGTYEFLTELQKILNTNHKINRKKEQQERNINSWNITISGRKDVLRILKLLYLDCSIYLKRKQKKAIIAIEHLKSLESEETNG